LWLMARPLDAVVCGEESARALGLRTGITFALVLLFASLATAASVAVGGILGFVGLAAPHVARKLVGAAHIRVIPASAILGAMLVILADLAARGLTMQELPLGPITSLVGGPLFLWVLRTQLRHLAGGAA
jgi:iron complex transport system permease protein